MRTSYELTSEMLVNCKITKVNLEEKCYVSRKGSFHFWRVHLGDGKERLSRVPWIRHEPEEAEINLNFIRATPLVPRGPMLCWKFETRAFTARLIIYYVNQPIGHAAVIALFQRLRYATLCPDYFSLKIYPDPFPFCQNIPSFYSWIDPVKLFSSSRENSWFIHRQSLFSRQTPMRNDSERNRSPVRPATVQYDTCCQGRATAIYIDKVSRFFFPFSFLILNVVYWSTFL